MDVSRANDEQATLWNGVAGLAWVQAQGLLDQILKPFEDVLVDAVVAGSGRAVLDVGCGTGSVTRAVASALGTAGSCVGVDISGPMITAARARGESEGGSASFIRADAQVHPFEPAGFDMIVSRFGVMFFDDAVRAFRNLRYAARDGAELRVITWRGAEENPFMTTAERAAAPLLPNLATREPDAPGQFAFADPDHVRRVLEQSDWTGIDIRPVDMACTLPEKELVRYLTLLGPVSRVLDEANDQLRARVLDTIRAAFDPFVHGAEVRFTAACWMVTAHADGNEISFGGAPL
jgi:ubiquinone/menaquinone biosynthesis C-methylase UbiE